MAPRLRPSAPEPEPHHITMNSAIARPSSWRPARLALCAALLAMGTAAQAGLFDDDEARRAILDLRQRIDQTAEAQKTGQARHNEQTEQLRRSILELNNQLEAMRGELARMRGQNEQLTRDVSEMQRKQTDLQQGLDDRMRQFEPQKVTVDGAEIQVRPEERREYEAALDAFRKQDYPAAATALSNFRTRYPNSGYAASVLYWLGNAQYGKRDYREAVTAFRSLVTGYPAHPRAPEAMLSIAMCQIELKDRPGARKTLDDLIKTHPQTEAAQEAKARLAALK